MKSLREYITEAETWVAEPAQGDNFEINIREECLIETHIVDVVEDGVVLHADDKMLALLEQYGYTMEEIRRYGAVGNNNAMGYTNEDEHPEQAKMRRAAGDAAQRKIDTPAAQRKASGDANWKVTLTDLYKSQQRHDSEHLRRLKELAGMHTEDANSNDPLMAKSMDDAAVPALEEDDSSSDAVASAITNRIMRAHLDVLSKHGPARVIAAIEDVAHRVGDVEEIGSSDTSIWTREVMQDLESGQYDHIKEEVTTDEPMPQQGSVASEPQDPLNPTHEVDEARDDFEDEEEAGEDPDKDKIPHIVMQARKALDVGGNYPLVFRDGTKSKMTEPVLRQFLAMYDVMKSNDKAVFQDMVSKSARDFHNIVTGEQDAVSEDKRTTHEDPLVTVHDRHGLHTHAHLSTVNDIFDINVSADDVHNGPVKTKNGHDGSPIVIQLSKHHATQVEKDLGEAEYRGREVPLGKPMAGDVKKKKVYVKKPNGNVVKVEFGDPNMRIKKHIPGRRKNFRARHNCDNPGPRWKARYWSCRAW